MTIGIIVQARTGSTRLPNKVFAALTPERTVLDYVLARVTQSKRAERVIVATTELARDDRIAELAESNGLYFFRGSETDVLGRYIGAMETFGLDAAVRITADCPLIEPQVIDDVIDLQLTQPSDYVFIEGYPRGSGDAELVTLEALRRAERMAGDREYYREHVITYLLDHPAEFKLLIAQALTVVQREVRVCVDEAADLELVRQICEHFAPRTDFALAEILEFLDAHPELAAVNAHVKQKTQ